MKQKRYAGTYHSVDNVLAKITELKSHGYSKEEIFAVSNSEDDDRMLEDQTDIVLTTREQDGWLSRMKFMFTNGEPAKEAFEQLGFNDQQIQAFYNEIKDGGTALFVLDDPNFQKQDVLINKKTTRYDSEGEMTASGSPLENDEEEIKTDESAGRYPRINTNNL